MSLESCFVECIMKNLGWIFLCLFMYKPRKGNDFLKRGKGEILAKVVKEAEFPRLPRGHPWSDVNHQLRLRRTWETIGLKASTSQRGRRQREGRDLTEFAQLVSGRIRMKTGSI